MERRCSCHKKSLRSQHRQIRWFLQTHPSSYCVIYGSNESILNSIEILSHHSVSARGWPSADSSYWRICDSLRILCSGLFLIFLEAFDRVVVCGQKLYTSRSNVTIFGGGRVGIGGMSFKASKFPPRLCFCMEFRWQCSGVACHGIVIAEGTQDVHCKLRGPCQCLVNIMNV